MLIHIMDTKDLESAVLDNFKNVYEKEYTGMIKVIKLKSGYKLQLGFGHNDIPYECAFDGNAEQFLNFICKELRKIHWDSIEFSELKKLYFTRGCCEG